MTEARSADPVALAEALALRDGDQETFRRRSIEVWAHGLAAVVSTVCAGALAFEPGAATGTRISVALVATAIVVEFATRVFSRLTVRPGGLEVGSWLGLRLVRWEDVRTAVSRPPTATLSQTAARALAWIACIAAAALSSAGVLHDALVLVPCAIAAGRLAVWISWFIADRGEENDLELYGRAGALLLLRNWPSRRAYEVVRAYLQLHRGHIRIVPAGSAAASRTSIGHQRGRRRRSRISRRPSSAADDDAQ